MTRLLSWLLLGIFVVAQAVIFAPRLFSAAEDTVKIALIGPMSGPEAEVGKAMTEGARLLIDSHNAHLQQGGKRIELVVMDDANDPAAAARLALEAAERKDILAVIGHPTDPGAEAAAAVYRENGLPAVTGGIGIPEITVGNDWFFRTGLTTKYQGVFMAHYVARVLGEKSIYLISTDDDYGRSVAVNFEDEINFMRRLSAANASVKKKWSFDPSWLDSSADEIATELARTYNGEAVFLAVGDGVAAELIRRLQENPRMRFGKPIPYKLIGPDSLAQPGVLATLSKLPRERSRPGYYTEGVYAVAPFLEDVANQRALEFRDAYLERYRREANVLAAGYYDAVTIVAAAVAKMQTGLSDIAAARQDLRDRLADFDEAERAVVGVTGNLLFDRDGNAVKSVPVGVYKAGKLVSPRLQLSTVGSIANIDGADAIQIFGNYFTPTRIVHAGLRINEISKIDLDSRRAYVDMNLWFRYRGDLNLKDIEFPNAVEPVDLGAPVEEIKTDGDSYSLFRVSGFFRTDFNTSGETFGRRTLGVQLRHGTLNRERLILVPDLLGMQQAGTGDMTDRVAKNTVFSDTADWAVTQAGIYLDTEPVTAMGNPQFVGRDVEGFSRINLGVVIEPTAITLRGLIDSDLALDLFLLFGLIAGALATIANLEKMWPYRRWFWFPQILIVPAMLFTGEAVAVEWLSARVSNPYYVELVALGFQMLWWLAPAWLINNGVEYFIWTPVENKTGRAVPPVVRYFFAGLVYTLAAMGIVAFVFDQKVTSLLATSGVLAMIIGLAIQMNLSNIFSGIAINVERPFRMGDWIRIGDYEPGKVVGITWRTTRIQTLDNNIICVPNSVASDSSVENLSYPREYYRSEEIVRIDPGAKPEWVEKILYDAVLSSSGALKSPVPTVEFRGVSDWSADYAVRFYCKDYEHSIQVEAEVWRDIVRNLRYAGFESVVHEEFTLFHLKANAGKGADIADQLIDDVDVFRPFDSEKRRSLIKHMKRLRLEPQRTVVTQGEDGDSLFIVAEGALIVEMKMDDDNTIEVGRLGPGDFFGEMALLTGEPRGATVTTLTPSHVFEIAKADIEPIIQQFPEIVEDLSQILTHRTLENLRLRNDHYASLNEESSLSQKILSKITSFFKINAPASKADAAE